jgi:orotate phosphoribosyltransferase
VVARLAIHPYADRQATMEAFRLGKSAARHHLKRNGEPPGWAFDLRVPLAQASILVPVARSMSALLRSIGLTQVAGRGCGAIFLLGAIASTDDSFRLGFVRDEPKPYGGRRIVEGAMEPGQPVALVDDLLNSGRSIARSTDVLRSEGFPVLTAVVLLEIGWGKGKAELQRRGLSTWPLATLERTGDRDQVTH